MTSPNASIPSTSSASVLNSRSVRIVSTALDRGDTWTRSRWDSTVSQGSRSDSVTAVSKLRLALLNQDERTPCGSPDLCVPLFEDDRRGHEVVRGLAGGDSRTLAELRRTSRCTYVAASIGMHVISPAVTLSDKYRGTHAVMVGAADSLCMLSKLWTVSGRRSFELTSF